MNHFTQNLLLSAGAELARPRDWPAELAQAYGAVLGVGRPDAQYFLDQGVQGADVPQGADVVERGEDVPRHADYFEIDEDASDVDDVNSEDEYDPLQVSCLWFMKSSKPMATS